jgi:hypothetical protein|tara:strand:- start:1219 stop:1842 length:624 start_codon:yes stop_codon:yes gene_type:complete
MTQPSQPNQSIKKLKKVRFSNDSDYISKTEERAMKEDFDGLAAKYRGYFFLFSNKDWKILVDSMARKNVHIGNITFEKLLKQKMKFFRNGKPNIKIVNRENIFDGSILPDKVSNICNHVVAPFVSALKTLSFPDSRTISLRNRSGAIEILNCPKHMEPLFTTTPSVNGIRIILGPEGKESEKIKKTEEFASTLSKKFSVTRKKEVKY